MFLVLFPNFIGVVSESNKMTGRWSNARQSVINAARELVVSARCKYGISELGEKADKATAVAELLQGEAFHFGKTNSVGDPQPHLIQSHLTSLLTDVQGTTNNAAPYQHPEMTLCLSRFFKGRGGFHVEFSERFHQGKYGLQMPQPMVALIATAVSNWPTTSSGLLSNPQLQIQATLKEWVTGVQVKRSFTESENRERYRDHIAAMQSVKDSKNGQLKYERMLSNIYAQTM